MITSGTYEIVTTVDVSGYDFEVHTKLQFDYDPAQPEYDDCPKADAQITVGIIEAYTVENGEKVKFNAWPIIEKALSHIKEEILAECVE